MLNAAPTADNTLGIGDVKGYTCLTHAIHYAHIDAFAYMLRKGADVTVTDYQRHSLLHWAVFKQNEAIMKILVGKVYASFILTFPGFVGFAR